MDNSTQQIIADYVFQNGKIYTVNEKLPIAEALAVKGDTIIYIGSGAGVSEFVGPNTIVRNIKGKLLLPGFIDAHTHPALGITMFSGFVIEPGWNTATIQKMLKKYVEAHPEKNYIFGFGYDNGLFGPEGPDKRYLDEVVPDKPLLLIAMDGHAAWLNSATLKLASI
ncbi:MAG: amidohydrolase family protein [Deltaproteobacteria bacterium]|nr:amidohydrolase family protein [Deltaproteobacteria bacterium]